MVKVRPFAALRPPKELVREVSSLPYDVMNSAEAAAMAGPKSLLHLTRSEIDFDPIADETEDRVYRQAADNFCTWQEKRYLVREAKPCYYVYEQTMGEHCQRGIILCAHADDYFSGAIKKHELTRRDKEDGRMKLVLIQEANLEPVFFCYKENAVLASIMDKVTAGTPEYDFVSPEDGFGHKMWVIDDDADIAAVSASFLEVPAMYIADGHHRSAAAARVGRYKAERNPGHTGEEEYNWFMAVCFPADELLIMDYNRVVKNLNGLSEEEFLEALRKDFTVEACENDPAVPADSYKPAHHHEFSMYMGGRWYRLVLRDGLCNDSDPLDRLDSGILSRLVLEPVLGITDIRTDSRIDFVGGIRGLGELQRRVDSGEMAAAFALCPVTMQQIMDVADAGEIMPPKSTWFEPKLRSGLTIHTFFEE